VYLPQVSIGAFSRNEPLPVVPGESSSKNDTLIAAIRTEPFIPAKQG
jgi:hypothetical protein